MAPRSVAVPAPVVVLAAFMARTAVEVAPVIMPVVGAAIGAVITTGITVPASFGYHNDAGFGNNYAWRVRVRRPVVVAMTRVVWRRVDHAGYTDTDIDINIGVCGGRACKPEQGCSDNEHAFHQEIQVAVNIAYCGKTVG